MCRTEHTRLVQLMFVIHLVIAVATYAAIEYEFFGIPTVDRLASLQDGMNAQFANVDAQFANVDAKIASVDAKLANVFSMLAEVLKLVRHEPPQP